jgi:hypothetical protein
VGESVLFSCGRVNYGSIVQFMVMVFCFFYRYSFTVCSNILVYLITWLVLHITSENDAQICPGDAGKFQVRYRIPQLTIKWEMCYDNSI